MPFFGFWFEIITCIFCYFGIGYMLVTFWSMVINDIPHNDDEQSSARLAMFFWPLVLPALIILILFTSINWNWMCKLDGRRGNKRKKAEKWKYFVTDVEEVE